MNEDVLFLSPKKKEKEKGRMTPLEPNLTLMLRKIMTFTP